MKLTHGARASLVCTVGVLCVTLARAQPAVVGSQLPKPDPAFDGRVAETYKDSTPSYPQPVKAPAGAPNVLLILLDDVGFGMAGTFGGPVPTPNLDKLAAGGLKYNHFHTTALCSPTRAALLAGRNHHTCGTGVIIEMGTGLAREVHGQVRSRLGQAAGAHLRAAERNGSDTGQCQAHAAPPRNSPPGKSRRLTRRESIYG